MLKLSEILKATRGRLTQGSSSRTVKGVSIDSRKIKKGSLFIAIRGEKFDGHDFIDEAVKKGAACIIKEKNRPYRTKAPAVIEVKDTQKALGDIANFWRNKFSVPVIAVTGSNGKTTAKDMIAWVLSKKFKVLKNQGTKNNQIGLPLTLLNLDASHDMAVLELGTNHFGEIGYLSRVAAPNIGAITNVGPAHLEHFGDLAGVFKEKYSLIRGLNSPAIAILNSDDDFLRGRIIQKANKPLILGFGIENQSDFFASNIKQYKDKLDFRVNAKYSFSLKALGRHNIYNALVAISIARVFGLGYNEIAERLISFSFPDSRLKAMRIKGVCFIDDTYNANPDSLKQALNSLGKFKASGRKIFVMGDMLELGKRAIFYHEQAASDVAKVCDAFIAVGKLAKFTARRLGKSGGFKVKDIFSCAQARQARDIIRNKLKVKKDDVILVKGSRLMKMEEVFK